VNTGFSGGRQGDQVLTSGSMPRPGVHLRQRNITALRRLPHVERCFTDTLHLTQLSQGHLDLQN